MLQGIQKPTELRQLSESVDDITDVLRLVSQVICKGGEKNSVLKGNECWFEFFSLRLNSIFQFVA